jgi:hypothetical protein
MYDVALQYYCTVGYDTVFFLKYFKLKGACAKTWVEGKHINAKSHTHTGIS